MINLEGPSKSRWIRNLERVSLSSRLLREPSTASYCENTMLTSHGARSLIGY